jgi:hypothetical protein
MELIGLVQAHQEPAIPVGNDAECGLRLTRRLIHVGADVGLQLTDRLA